MEYKSETKNCQNCKTQFTIEPEDFKFYEKIKVPTPTRCHDCRLQTQLTWRNERTLYKINCSLCGKSIISVFSADKKFQVYCYSCFHGDNWDPLAFGVNVDFSVPFLEQFRKLQPKIPRLYSLVFNNINSDYAIGAGYDKNCYLIFVSDHNEDCSYSYDIFYCRNSLDLNSSFNCEYSYELSNCLNCQNSRFCFDCKDSFELFFSRDCINCNNLVGCVGLRGKSYCIFNKQYTKEEYFKEIEKVNLNSYSSLENLKIKFTEFQKKYPVKYIHGVNNYNVKGDVVNNSKNAHLVFYSKELEDCKYVIIGNKAKDCYECYVAVDNSELCFNSLGCASTRNTITSHLPWMSYNLIYCDGCESCSECIGCVSLHHKKYCILNKQYQEEEYFLLKKKIIEHLKNTPFIDSKGRKYFYGDFFPSDFSPYDYNETAAIQYYPLTKEEALNQGYRWKEKEEKNYKITINSTDLPDEIKEVGDSILDEIIGCAHNGLCNEQCTEAFKITKNEFLFYKRLNLPLPHLCHNCRHYQRLKLENPRKLWHRKCMKPGCPNEFETSYSPERLEIVYCEGCYNKEVY